MLVSLEHWRFARAFSHFSYIKSCKMCKLRTAATMITQILRRNVEKMKVRVSNLQFSLVTQLRVNSASDMSPWWSLGLHRLHQVINDLAYKLCWLDWSPVCGYLFMSPAPPNLELSFWRPLMILRSKCQSAFLPFINLSSIASWCLISFDDHKS